MSDAVSVCYSGNKKVFPGLLLSVLSLAKYTQRPLHLYILSMDLHEQDAAYLPFSENQIHILNRVLKEKNAESRAELIDVGERFRKDLLSGKNLKNYYTPYAQLRLYLSELEGLPDKLIYLDIDTMAASDIGQLYDVEIDGYEYAAALDYMGKFWVAPDYCNSGVLLLNLPELRRTGLFPRVRRYMAQHRMFMPDQTALHRLHRKRLILPMRFNEQRQIKQDTVVKHFCRGIFWFPFFHLYNIKQWERDAVHKRLKIYYYDDLYEKYDRLAAQYSLDE